MIISIIMVILGFVFMIVGTTASSLNDRHIMLGGIIMTIGLWGFVYISLNQETDRQKQFEATCKSKGGEVYDIRHVLTCLKPNSTITW